MMLRLVTGAMIVGWFVACIGAGVDGYWPLGLFFALFGLSVIGVFAFGKSSSSMG